MPKKEELRTPINFHNAQLKKKEKASNVNWKINGWLQENTYLIFIISIFRLYFECNEVSKQNKFVKVAVSSSKICQSIVYRR